MTMDRRGAQLADANQVWDIKNLASKGMGLQYGDEGEQ